MNVQVTSVLLKMKYLFLLESMLAMKVSISIIGFMPLKHTPDRNLLQTGCILCRTALNNRIAEYERKHGVKVRPDEISKFSMQHKGKCYRNSNLTPAVAEEPQAEIAAADLLIGPDGKYVGDGNRKVVAYVCGQNGGGYW